MFRFKWEGLYQGGREDLHPMSAEKQKLKLISLISLFGEVREVMGSWKL